MGVIMLANSGWWAIYGLSLFLIIALKGISHGSPFVYTGMNLSLKEA